jgi:serine/threonine protein phosphatase PrpC
MKLKNIMYTIKFKMAARCESAGRPNSKNEDSFLVNDNLTTGQWSAAGNASAMLFDTDREICLGGKGALMVVCDGMGGMNAGEVASSLAVETVRQWFSSGKLTDAVIASPETVKRHIEQTIIAADASIKREGAADREHEGMGSTIVLAWIIGKSVYVGWCGDSRAYRFNPADGLKQLSRDHSYVQELVDAKKLSEDLAFDHPNSNIITRSLGDPGKTARPDIRRYDLRENDVIFLCSDGLCGVVRDEEIEAVMRQNAGSMAALRDALWEAARNAPWHDNCTVELCRITSGGDAVAPGEQSRFNPERQPGQPVDRRSSEKRIRILLYIIIAALALALGVSVLCNVRNIPVPGITKAVTECGKPSEEKDEKNSELRMIVENLREISGFEVYNGKSIKNLLVFADTVDLSTAGLSKIDLSMYKEGIVNLKKRTLAAFDKRIADFAGKNPADTAEIKKVNKMIDEAFDKLTDTLHLKKILDKIEEIEKPAQRNNSQNVASGTPDKEKAIEAVIRKYYDLSAKKEFDALVNLFKIPVERFDDRNNLDKTALKESLKSAGDYGDNVEYKFDSIRYGQPDRNRTKVEFSLDIVVKKANGDVDATHFKSVELILNGNNKIIGVSIKPRLTQIKLQQ